MKKICIMLLINGVFARTLFCQTLIQQVEDIYNSFDSISYIENIILLYKVDLVVREQIMIDHNGSLGVMVSKPAYNNLDIMQRQYMIDSLMKNMSIRSKTLIEKRTNEFIFDIKDKSMYYVLNLQIDTCGQLDKRICLLPDTNNLPFSLFHLDKHSKNNFYVFVDSGTYVYHSSAYPTFSTQIGKNIPKVFKRILKKKPKYLLFCNELEGMNTILYILNDKIYVYRIIQMKEYELQDYINFRMSEIVKNNEGGR